MKPKWKKPFFFEAKHRTKDDIWSEMDEDSKVVYAHDVKDAMRVGRKRIRKTRHDANVIFELYDFRARER